MIEMAGLSAEELAFMGSPEGEAAIARARRDHDLRTRSQPDALGWSIGHVAACSALRIRVADLREAEERARRAGQQEAAREGRDELAAEIADRYPALVRELTGLAKRIAECNAQCEAAGIPATAEAQGRGVPANFMVSGGTLATIGSIFGEVQYLGLDA